MVPFWFMFCVWCEIGIHLQSSTKISSCVSTTCWKTIISPIVLSWNICRKSIDYKYMKLFLGLQFYSINLYVLCCVLITTDYYTRLPWWLSDKVTTCQSRRLRFSPWVRKILWRRKWQPTPVFLPGKPHGQRSWQATVHGVAKESDKTW